MVVKYKSFIPKVGVFGNYVYKIDGAGLLPVGEYSTAVSIRNHGHVGTINMPAGISSVVVPENIELRIHSSENFMG